MPQLTTLYIPGWSPTPLNKLMHGHWSNGAKAKKADREILSAFRLMHDLLPAKGKRYVKLIVGLEPRQRAWDGDALWKSTLDGLVSCGLLRDDSPAWCVCEPVRYVRGEERFTVIVLEEK